MFQIGRAPNNICNSCYILEYHWSRTGSRWWFSHDALSCAGSLSGKRLWPVWLHGSHRSWRRNTRMLSGTQNRKANRVGISARRSFFLHRLCPLYYQYCQLYPGNNDLNSFLCRIPELYSVELASGNCGLYPARYHRVLFSRPQSNPYSRCHEWYSASFLWPLLSPASTGFHRLTYPG